MKKYIKPLLAVLVVVMLGIAYYLYHKTQTVETTSPQAVAQKETDDLVATVGKLILLPTGEVPTTATVSDPSKLQDQPFFAKAKAGDKVLLYQNAKKAYLYDSVNNRILEVAPININPSATTSTTTSKTATTTPAKKITNKK